MKTLSPIIILLASLFMACGDIDRSIDTYPCDAFKVDSGSEVSPIKPVVVEVKRLIIDSTVNGAKLYDTKLKCSCSIDNSTHICKPLAPINIMDESSNIFTSVDDTFLDMTKEHCGMYSYVEDYSKKPLVVIPIYYIWDFLGPINNTTRVAQLINPKIIDVLDFAKEGD